MVPIGPLVLPTLGELVEAWRSSPLMIVGCCFGSSFLLLVLGLFGNGVSDYSNFWCHLQRILWRGSRECLDDILYNWEACIACGYFKVVLQGE